MCRAERSLRAHHLLCVQFFQGKGYSAGFAGHMRAVVEALDRNPPVRLVAGGDDICAACPNLQEGQCRSAEKTAEYDRRVLALCQWQEGRRLSAREAVEQARRRIIEPGLRRQVCGTCQWSDLCR